MKKFYLFTLTLLATLSSLFAQLTVEPKTETAYNAEATEWYRILFIPDAGGDYSVLTATETDNAPLKLKPEIVALDAEGAAHQLWQFVGTKDAGYELVSKTGIHAYVDVTGYTLNGAKAKTEAQNFLHITASNKADYSGLKTQQLRLGNLTYFLNPADEKCGVAQEASLKASVVFKKVAVGSESSKMCTLTSQVSGYESATAKVVFEGATDGKVEEGKKVILKVTNDSEQYTSPYIKTIKVNGVSLTEGFIFEETYEKEITVTEDTQVEVEFFKPKQLIVSFMNEAKAEVKVTADVPTALKQVEDLRYLVVKGTEVEVKVTPEAGYELISISPSAKFKVKKNTTFVKLRFKSLVAKKVITIPEVENGTITLEGINSGDQVEVGKKVKVTVTPKEGYELETLTVGGVDIKETKEFTVGDNNDIVVKFKTTSAVEGLDAVLVSVYPNPATDFVHLRGLTPNAKVRLLSLTGQTVLTTQAGFDGSATFNVNKLAKGLYLVRSNKTVVKVQVR